MQSWNRTSHFKSHLFLIWNFQMRLEMRSAIWNFWNFLKLELLIWNFQMRLEMRCTIWNFKKPIVGSCLFETCRWDLKWDVLFETWNLFNLFKSITKAAYLKLSDETWKNIYYLKFLKLETFTNMSLELLIWNFQMRLEKEVLFETFETWNFSIHYRGWSFETLRWDLRLDVLVETFETWNFSNFKTHLRSWLFETFR